MKSREDWSTRRVVALHCLRAACPLMDIKIPTVTYRLLKVKGKKLLGYFSKCGLAMKFQTYFHSIRCPITLANQMVKRDGLPILEMAAE